MRISDWSSDVCSSDLQGMNDQPMVHFESVRKSYGLLVVLDDLNLKVAAGEKVAVIGPSGSGKTNVLRMLMTLERINDGVIYVDGEPLTHMPRHDEIGRASCRARGGQDVEISGVAG